MYRLPLLSMTPVTCSPKPSVPHGLSCHERPASWLVKVVCDRPVSPGALPSGLGSRLRGVGPCVVPPPCRLKKATALESSLLTAICGEPSRSASSTTRYGQDARMLMVFVLSVTDVPPSTPGHQKHRLPWLGEAGLLAGGVTG